jgi:cytochrome c oxidase subunit 3
LCFFGGVWLGQTLEAEEAGSHEGHADHHLVQGHVDHASHDHSAAEHAEHPAEGATIPVAAMSAGEDVKVMKEELTTPNADVNQKSMAGLFFSIYYCMTGVHAVHILGGMAVITWLIVKAAREEFHEQYFGPVDNVGLYWHLVDFIWIYLFPLLYLIT